MVLAPTKSDRVLNLLKLINSYHKSMEKNDEQEVTTEEITTEDEVEETEEEEIEEKPEEDGLIKTDGPVARSRSELVQAIADIYSNSAPASVAVIEEIDSILNGIPDEVATAVLYDWLADVTQTAPDPDPETDETSSLNQRIIRQLTRLGIDLNTLSDAWQSRVQNSTRQ